MYYMYFSLLHEFTFANFSCLNGAKYVFLETRYEHLKSYIKYAVIYRASSNKKP